MNNTIRTLLALGSLSLALFVPAKADVLAINWNGTGGFVGSADPGTPASVAQEVIFVNHLLGMGASATDTVIDPPKTWNYATSAVDYNGSVTSAGSANMNVGDAGFSYSGSGFEYVLAKYGNTDYVWYVGFADFSFTKNIAGEQNALSHWAGFNVGQRVPDSASTVALLGLSLVAVAFAGRRKQAA